MWVIRVIFVRIRQIYNNNFEKLQADVSSFSFTDEQTRKAMSEIYDKSDYIADPHGSVGLPGAQEVSGTVPELTRDLFLKLLILSNSLKWSNRLLGVKVDYPGTDSGCDR